MPWLACSLPTCSVGIKYANVSRLRVDQFFHQPRCHLSQDSLVPSSQDTFWWKSATLTQLCRRTTQGFCLTSRSQSWLASARLATVPARTRSDGVEVPTWWFPQQQLYLLCVGISLPPSIITKGKWVCLPVQPHSSFSHSVLVQRTNKKNRTNWA